MNATQTKHKVLSVFVAFVLAIGMVPTTAIIQARQAFAAAGDITVTSTAAAELTAVWNDNSGSTAQDPRNAGDRPTADDYANNLQLLFQVDGGGWTTLTEDNRATIGLDAMPAINVNSDTLPWHVSASDLPTAYTYEEPDGTTTSHTVAWAWAQDTLEGYLAPVFDADPAITPATVTNNVCLTWKSTVSWLDNGNLYTSRPGLQGQFTLYRYVAGSTAPADVCTDATLSVTANDDNTWSLALEGAQAYSPEGLDYIYYVVPTDDALDADTGNAWASDAGSYQLVYTNQGNYSSNTDGLYYDGNLTATLVDTTHFEATKIWEDDGSTARPACTLYLYRIAEDADGSISTTQILNSSPVQGFDNTPVATSPNTVDITIGQDATGAEPVDLLPAYDNDGRRYIYFGLERGATGDYQVIITNDGSPYGEQVKATFADPAVCNNGAIKFVLNGGTIKNDRETTITLPATKTFYATAMQSMEDAYVVFQLQKNVNGGGWQPATSADLVDFNPATKTNVQATDTAVNLRISGFSAELMSITDPGLTVQKYVVATGASIEYRWVETTLCVNGGFEAAPTFDGTTGTYGLVNADVVAPGLLDKYTTAFFQPKQVSNTEISNTLQGELQVTVTKTWTDAKGNNISNDGVQLSGVSATFNVTRNDGKTTADGSLLDSSGKVVQPLVLTQANYDAGAQAWVGSWSNLVRYDETGTEYLYKVSEATISDPQSRTWSSTHTVVNSVTTTTDDAKIIKKEVKFANTTGPIPTLDFDVEKQWLDGDDALTRYPVQVGVYRITTGEQVATAELRASNDWYARISVAKADDTDTTANYVVKEIQINNVQPDYGANTDQQIYDQATTHTGNYAYANAVGVLDEGDANHNLAYKYNVFVERTATVDRTATYVVTNQRVGVLNLNLTKTWTMAASKPDATFAVYSGTTQLDKAALDGMGATVVDGAGASVTVADGGTFQLASGTDNTATVRVQDLPKYDTQGNLITYSLVETSMTLGGETQAIVDGVAQLSGDRYVASISENVDKRVIVGPTKHNSGDEYYWEASNARSETYNLTARKVWRDDGTALNDVARPDIHLSVYRVLPSDVSGLTEAIAAGNTGQIISAIRGAGNAWQAVSGDHFWDTTPNDWYWECDLGSVERYSSTGEAYVYFFTESYPGDRGHYQAIYSNLTSGDGYRPTEDVPDTGDTVDVYSVTRNQLISASGNLNNAEALCLLSDGVHAVGTDVGAYYSGTVVNYREDTRTITARKMWLLPTGWVLPDSAKPSVAVHLYVSDTPLTDDAGNVVTRYTHDILQPKLQNSTLVTTVTLNGTDNPGVYEHEFQNLPRYDEFGRTYYYFLDESIGVPAVGTNMYPGSLVDGTNFTIENVYDMTQGNHVKVTVNKTWTSNTVAGVTVDDLTAPATFNLYAQAQDANGNLVGEKIKMSAVTFTPSATQQSYTFMKYTAGKNVADYTAAELAACNDLPEEGANNRPMVYWVEEDTPNGYKSTLTSSTGGSADNPVAFDSNYAGTVSYSNEYTGAPDDVTFTKIWEDASTSIDTSYYRPRGVSAIPGLQNLHFTVSRAWPGNPAIPGDTGGSETVSAVQFPQSTWDSAFTAWKTTQTYEKYAPNGMPYTYKVDSEQGSYNDAGGSISFLYTHVFDGTTATNTLKTVSVSGAKKWIDAATGETLSWADFSRFSNYKDALPTHVTLAVQYCYQPGTAPGAQNKWKFIDDTDPDGQYAEVYLRIGANAEKTDANVVGGTYLGKTWKVSDLTQSTYNNMSISYADLPRYTATSQSSPMDVEIPYRVVEGLTWADGTTTWYYADDAVNDTLQAPSTPWKAITGQITRTVSDTGTTCTLNNTVGTVPITVVKDWVDNSNRDDTRPISLEVYFSSKDGIESTKVTLAKSSTYPPGDRWTATLSLPMPSGGTAQLANLFNVNEDTVTLTTLDYTQTENTGFVVNAGTGAVSCSFTNTLDDIPRATTSAAFTKTFKDDGAWASLTRPTVRYQLYAERMDDAGTLVKIDDTNKNQFFDDVHLDQATAQTVTIDNNTGSGSVTWEGLYQYWPRNETNAGDPQKIVYRVQEELLDSNGNVITTSAYSADNPSITAGGKITNTLQTTDVTFTKNWVDSKGNVIAINATLAQRLIDAGLMPVKLQFSAEYQVAGDTAWTDSGLSVQHTPAELLSRPTWNAKLPAYDKDGKALTWRVHEQVSYDGTTYQDAGYYANVVPNDNGYFTATNGAVTATNTLNYGSLTVTKAWDDDNNRDGVRPASVTVNLYRDGATTAYATATLSANNNWTYTFDYLPAYQDVATGGTPTASTWTVEEAAITVDTTKVSTGYTVSYMIEGATTSTTTLAPTDAKSATITNTHVPERINVPVTKTWVGQMYPTKVQNLPNDLTVQLYMDDTAVEGSTLKLNDGNSWTGSFTNLYKYRDAGTLIDYTVAETAMGILYGDLWEPNCTSTVTGSAADGYTITNTLETADVQVSKTWLYPDGTTIAATDVQDLVDAGELPTTLRFALDQSAGTTPDWVPTGFTVDFTTVDLADGPQTWDANLLRHARVNSDGTVTDYDYQLRETAVSYDNGTTWVNIEDTNLTTADAALTYANGVFTTTVNNTFPTGDLTVTKTWDDGDNRDGLRPTSVNVKLYRDGATTAYATATLSAANNWTYTFQDLPVYKEGTTTMSVWTVTETAVDGYTTSYEPTSLTLTAGQTGSFAITNSHTPATTSVSGTKTWTGLHSNDSLPAQITVNLLANGTKVQSKTVTAADNWAYSFDNLYQYENGALIAYTVTEDAVPQFTTAVKGFNIVNTYAPAKTSVSGTKTWANMSVYDSKPASITLRLTGTAGDAVVRTDTQVVTQAADGTWTYEFADLDAYTADNQAITYTVEEQAVPYFTTTYTATDAGFDITNIYAPDTVTVAGTKTWKDVPEGDPLPQQVFVVVGGLDESGTLVRGAYKWVSAADNWAYTFTDLPGHTADGQQITYKVDEMPMEGFTPTISGYDIENAYTPDKTFFTANKVWEGVNPNDTLPASIELTLTGTVNGQVERTVTQTVTPGASGWTYTFYNLDKYDAQDREIVYSVSETPVPQFTTAIQGGTITNTYAPEKTSVSGTKTWEGVPQGDALPDMLTLHLVGTAEDGAVVRTAMKMITANSGWTYTFDDLDAYTADNQKITYSVYEDVPPQFTATYDGFDITNTYTPATTSVSGTKTWKGVSFYDSLPASITLNLTGALEDGTVVRTDSQTVTPAADGTWTYSFDGLDAYTADNQAITYTVEEQELPYFTTTYTTTDTGFDITNTYAPDTVTVAGTKTWAKVPDGETLPERVFVVLGGLNENGELVRGDYEWVTADNNWTYTFADKPAHTADGQQITYKVDEMPMEGFTPTITGYDILNTYTPDKTFFTANKVWAGTNAADHLPASIELTLTGTVNGQVERTVTQTVTPGAQGWTYTFYNLDKTDGQGNTIEYAVSEKPVPQFTTTVQGGTITNTYAPEKTQVSGTKTWVGVNAADALPASITVNLTGKLADGTQVRTGTQTVTPAADGTWAYSFADLDAYTADNQAITYTLTEDVPAQFTSSVNGYDFTNTYDPEKTSVRGAKVWTGVGDGAALPSQITVNLAGATPDGTVVRTDSQVVQAATDGTWAYLFDNLDAYTADNQAITYTVTEDPIPGYETSIVEGDITNTYTGGASQQLTVTKTWADASNQDGMRPATVRFTVKNGSAVMASADVTGDSTADSWTHTFTGLPKYDTAGQSITYTVEEAAVDGYTTTGGECTYQGDETWAAAFTNTHVPETTSVHVDLTWDDAGDEYSTRPDSVEVELYANGQPTGQRITLTPDGNWEGTFDNLPKYKDGEEITYTVQEVVPNRYSYTIAGDMENGFKLVNTLPQSEIDKIKKQNTNNNTNTTNRTSTTSSTTASTGDTTPVLPFAGLGLLSMLVAVAAAWMARRKDDAA